MLPPDYTRAAAAALPAAIAGVVDGDLVVTSPE
jgi:hypothetical protein